jgi:iron(III) transport system ATP-binding protein
VITSIDFAGFVSTLNLQMAADGAQLEIKTVSREGLRPGAQVSLNVMGQAHIFTG